MPGVAVGDEAQGRAALDLRPFVNWILDELEPAVRVEPTPGAYARELGADDVELYGTTDMACILHTIGHLHPRPEERDAWVATILGFQGPGGEIRERDPTHDVLHNTAFAVGALELLGTHIDSPPTFVDPYRDPAAALELVEGLDWQRSVWGSSHRGAGLGALFAMIPDLAPPGWFDAYFEALDARVDPTNGMLGDDREPGGDIDQIGGTFHYLFLYEWAHRPMPQAEARIDAVLGLQQGDGRWFELSPHWLTLDALYILTRSGPRSGYRTADVDAAVRAAAAAVAADALDERRRSERFGGPLGVHELTAAVSILAEAQRRLGSGEVRTDRPLRLVLDRRPFI